MTIQVGGSRISRLIFVVLFFAVSTIIMTYPLSIHPATTVRDAGDPLMSAWMLAWMTNAIVTQPLDIFQTNIFYPFPDTLAFTDAPMALLIIAAPIIWITRNPVLAINITLLAGFFFSGLGAFLLSWHLTRSTGAGIVAGIVFAFCPYRIAHLSHSFLLNAQWIPLTLFFLHRGFEGRRWRNFFGFGACYVLQAFSSVYYEIFLTLAVALFVLYFSVGSPSRHIVEFLLKLFAVWLCAGLAIIPYLQPYWRMQALYGFERPLFEIEYHSADLKDYFAVPQEIIIKAFAFVGIGSEHCLFPGLSPILLAVLGLFIVPLCHGRLMGAGLFIVPPRHDRAERAQGEGDRCLEPGPKVCLGLYLSRSQGFYLGLAACAFVLSLGPTLRVFGHPTGIILPYMILYKYCPGFNSLRAVSRFAVVVSVALAVLAGDGFARIVNRIALRWNGQWSRIVSVAVIALIMMSEYAAFPFGVVPIEVGPQVPEVYRWLAHQDAGATVFELPCEPISMNARYEYFSAYHWRRIVNGFSGFHPRLYLEMTRILEQLPSGDSVGLLRALGIDLVILHEDSYRPEEFRKLQSRIAENPNLLAVQSFGKDHVYRVRQRAGGQIGQPGTEADISKSTQMLVARIRMLGEVTH